MRSLWLEEALAGEDEAPPLAGEERADVCVVGGGYTGLWAALRLKELEPALDVAVVERDICGGGGSGRNGGLVLTWWAKYGVLARICGVEEAVRLCRVSEEAVAALGTLGVDCHYRGEGWLWTATSPAQVGAWDETLAAAERAGAEPFERLSADEVARRAGSPAHLAGVYERVGATIQPALLARGLRRLALERGVRVFERSPMERLAGTRVECANGSVEAGRVVVATGAWSGGFRELRNALAVISSDIVATAPVPDRLVALGIGGVAIDDARMMVHYYRSTLDGRLVFGKGGGWLAYGARVGARFDEPRRSAEVEAALRATYPQLADVPVERAWSGPIDRTRSAVPFFWRVRPGVVVGAGYSGTGVAQSWVGGRVLASLALDRDDEWSACGLVGPPPASFPPEPVRYAGGRAVRAAVARKERAEDEGRRPRRLDAWVSRLAPTRLRRPPA